VAPASDARSQGYRLAGRNNRRNSGSSIAAQHGRMSTHVDEREWLAPKEVAHELRVHVSAIYRAVERGELRALRLSETGAIRIHRSVLDQRKERP
jgi:excisionase family DNA binding protein